MKNPENWEKAIKGMNVLNDIVFSLINMIMLVSPIGVFFLMGDSFGRIRSRHLCQPGVNSEFGTLLSQLCLVRIGTGLLRSYLGVSRRSQSS